RRPARGHPHAGAPRGASPAPGRGPGAGPRRRAGPAGHGGPGSAPAGRLGAGRWWSWTWPSQPVAEVADTVWMPPVSWFTTCLTWLLGMANPTPMLPDSWADTLALAVVIPTT